MVYYFAEEIKSKVKMPDIVSFYGFEPVRNRISCPFHNGKDRNLSFKEDFFKCFVCGEKGDVITFVQKYFHLSFFDAVKKLNEDFRLGIPIDKPLTLRRKREIEMVNRDRERLMREKKEKKLHLEAEWEEALSEYKRYEFQKMNYAPKFIGDEPHPLFVEALKNIEFAQYKLDEAERRLHDLV